MTWLEQEDEHVVDMPAQWGGSIPSEVFLEEVQRIVREGEKLGLILRVMGGVGIGLHTTELADLGHRLGRLGSGKQEFTDLDFMAYKKRCSLSSWWIIRSPLSNAVNWGLANRHHFGAQAFFFRLSNTFGVFVHLITNLRATAF